MGTVLATAAAPQMAWALADAGIIAPAKRLANLGGKSLQAVVLGGSIGAAALSVIGSAVGAVTGATMGLMAGVPMALFTFGLSLPAGFLAGGACGAAAGAAVGCGVGTVLGAASLGAHVHRKELKAAISQTRVRAVAAVRVLLRRCSLDRAPKGNRALRGRATWPSGHSADGLVVLSRRVMDVEGRALSLGQRVGPGGDAVIVFMRHLGCPFSWALAREWSKPEVRDRVRALGMTGPLLISMGTPAQLTRFLEVNPSVPRELAFVDPSEDFAAYTAIGFGGPTPVPGLALPRLPPLGLRSYASCLFNMTALAPLPRPGYSSGESTQIMGGTVVVRAGKVVYGWGDRVPGDYPRPPEVLDSIAQGILGPSAAKAA